jgi:hypothetical protein
LLYKDYFTDFFEFFKGVEENGFGEYQCWMEPGGDIMRNMTA